eukprot:Colp12_sorted_trinity150504_noHs@34691
MEVIGNRGFAGTPERLYASNICNCKPMPIDGLDVFVKLLSYTRGRMRVLMLVQYSSKLTSWLLKSYAGTAERFRILEGAVSEARKSFRYFRFIEEWKELQKCAKEQDPWTPFSVLSHIFSMYYMLLDNIQWLMDLRVIGSPERLRKALKTTKNFASLFRIILDVFLDTCQHRKDVMLLETARLSRPQSAQSINMQIRKERLFLLLKQVENVAHLVIALNGARLKRTHGALRGALGSVAALFACYRLWDVVEGEAKEEQRLTQCTCARLYNPDKGRRNSVRNIE